MTNREEMQEEPFRFDFFATMRLLERSFPDQPRIGQSASRLQDYVDLGQDPFMDFPASNLARVEPMADGKLRISTKFLGLLGPQGALPFAVTEEAFAWESKNDHAFARFLDLINNRFLQLFFRAWADARPIAQHDRPAEDRFKTYVGAAVGLGSSPFADLDTVPDDGKFRLAGLAAPQVKSASRLKAMVRDLFGVDAEIEAFIGTRLALETHEQSALGSQNSRLGQDTLLGASCLSIEDKFRLRLYVADMAQYRRFLPTGDRCEPLNDLVFFYVGEVLDWDVELALPTEAVEPMRLGGFGQVGWTSWLSPRWDSKERYRCDARFHPAEQMRQRRRPAA